ncbi:polyamine transporter tpo5 [Friedmanniomyces endolithicus]|nr:polyamine transporter tpo5 [Friedmanniomyces endolithicus]KAK0807107.1 polyamine transporter tpo5 [Friedmanniomyces endolithicus]KAK0818526.1 polyamine transporter tpo5 [Friedmanniomyces endolithicus]
MDTLRRNEKSDTPSYAVATSQAEKDRVTIAGRPAMATIEDDDERLLARIGYKQELKREFNKWSTVSYAISLLGVLGSQPATYGVPISLGGPATAVWAWFIGSVMAMVIASCVAELVSAYPTAGGMYFVTKQVVPPEHVAIWAWIIGWCNFLGQATGVASLAYTIGRMILAGASMNSGYSDGSYGYSPTAAQTVLVALLTLVVFGAICSLTTKALHRVVLWFAPINILATIGICIALLVLTPDKRSARFVFTDIEDHSGWGSKGFSFLLGFLNVAWVMTDYDGTTHMSEETHDAAVRGPLAIRLAVLVSGVLGWFLNITFTFCLTPDYMNDIVGSPTGLPIAQIFLNAGGRSGGTAMLFFVILVQFFTGATALLANARMTYAFARDEALPFSSFWSKINATTGTPVNAVWLVVVFCGCLNLIGIGSTETITAIFNLCAPCLDLSYVAVLFAHQVYAHRVQFIEGPYTLGKWSKPLNILAISWVLFISVVLFFPTTRPVTATNMNYAIAVAGFVGMFSLGWWWAGARKKYTGPRTQDIMSMVDTFEREDYA